jgi:hypothetical protein
MRVEKDGKLVPAFKHNVTGNVIECRGIHDIESISDDIDSYTIGYVDADGTFMSEAEVVSYLRALSSTTQPGE